MSRRWIALLLLLACADQSLAVRKARLSPRAREVFEQYAHFMTSGQIDAFFALADDHSRAQYLQSLDVPGKIAQYPQAQQEAMWRQEVIRGMDRSAVLLTWGVPREREVDSEAADKHLEVERWYYVRPEGKRTVVLTTGVVTDVTGP